MTMAKAKSEPKKRTRRPRNSSTSRPAAWFVDWFGGGQESESGYQVTPAAALTYAYVWQATLIISGDVAGLPLNVYDRGGDDTREVNQDHPAYWLLNMDASPWMSGRTLRETLTAHALLYGNGYALIARRAGVPIGLSPLLPDRTECLVEDGAVVYKSRIDGNRQPVTYRAEDVLHIKGLGFDGLCGYSVVTMARNSLGLGLSLQRHGNTHFKNGAYPGVVLKTPRVLQKPEADTLLAHWENRHAGSDNKGKTALLHGGLDLETLPISNEDAQWLESRKFQAKEVAAWFNLPPHKLGDESRTSYNSLETEERSYLTTSLKHWIDRWEDEANRKLLTMPERRNRTSYLEHNLSERLRPDSLQRFQGYESGIRNRWLSPNEVRRLENMPPREGGDTYENPNTSSGRSQDPAEPPPREDLAAAAAHRRLIAGAVSKLIHLECDRINRCAKRPAEFATLVDKFYDEQFKATWARELEPIFDAASTVMAISYDASEAYETHAATSRQSLLEVSGRSYPETLAENVAAVTETWASRPDEIVSYLTQGE